MRNAMEWVKENMISGEFLLLIPLAYLSLILFFGYKSVCMSYKNPKYAKYRYKEILWIRIFAKTTIFVPIFYWFLSHFRFFSLHTYAGFFISWLIWCAILFVFRKIYRKIRKSNKSRLPSSFYNKNN